MSINTAATKLKSLLLAGFCLAWVAPYALAQTTIGPWVPIFKGIDLALATNTPGNGATFAELQVIRAIRMDLTDPDIRFFPTPRAANFVLGSQETSSSTLSAFMTNYGCQLVINANFFDPSGNYYPPPGTSMYVYGEEISKGIVVSVQESSANAATLFFTTNNTPTYIPTNWPPASAVGYYSAVSGNYAILVNNVNVGLSYLGNSDALHQINPRTSFGLSHDRHYLYLMTLDGRQPGYSDGSYDWETAKWMQMLGAWDAADMDGGGSTELVQQDTTGIPVMLNYSSAVAGGGERQIGSMIGFYARPLANLITNVVSNPDDTATTITWQTTNAATAQVNYGPTLAFGLTTPLLSALTTNHAVLLTNLAPSSQYYFQVVSTVGANTYVSSNYAFVTTNYVVTSRAFDVTKVWTWTTNNLDGVNWTAKTYNDAGFAGSGPGFLWYDQRGGANALPLDHAEMGSSGNPSNANYPYGTYYLRTHFTLPAAPPVNGLVTLSNYVDDGAVFYLNGAEAYRLRMPAAPALISNNTLATGFPCSGDATCPDIFTVTGDILTNLVAGDNVLAAEVHNYNARSPDVTFGSALYYSIPITIRPTLTLTNNLGVNQLTWTRGGVILQQAGTPTGPWTNSPGPVISSPFNFPQSGPTLFYRLAR